VFIPFFIFNEPIPTALDMTLGVSYGISWSYGTFRPMQVNWKTFLREITIL